MLSLDFPSIFTASREDTEEETMPEVLPLEDRKWKWKVMIFTISFHLARSRGLVVTLVLSFHPPSWTS